MPAITIKNISKRFGKNVQALQDVNLKVKNGEILALLGPSGAGKTTLLRIICGLLKPEAGQIYIDGKDITKQPPEKRRIAYLPQTYSLFSHLSVWENTVFSPKVLQRPTKEWEELGNEILSMVGLRLRRYSYPLELSGGMKQRLALSRALATDFDILLLDEPLRALDARLRIELREELNLLSRSLKKTVIWVTHDQIEAMSVADRLAILHEGRIQQVGDSYDLYENPQTPFCAEFLGESNYFQGRSTESLTNPERMIIHTEDGINIESTAREKLNGRVSAFVKTENCRPIFSQPNSTSNFGINGYFKTLHFLGRWSVLTFKITDITDIRCRVDSEIVKEWKFQPNTPVSIEIDPDKVNVFPLNED
ncbi:MAG: ABC transporter ATP-binding protein [Promethearchaeota archaeon]